MGVPDDLGNFVLVYAGPSNLGDLVFKLGDLVHCSVDVDLEVAIRCWACLSSFAGSLETIGGGFDVVGERAIVVLELVLDSLEEIYLLLQRVEIVSRRQLRDDLVNLSEV